MPSIFEGALGMQLRYAINLRRYGEGALGRQLCRSARRCGEGAPGRKLRYAFYIRRCGEGAQEGSYAMLPILMGKAAMICYLSRLRKEDVRCSYAAQLDSMEREP